MCLPRPSKLLRGWHGQLAASKGASPSLLLPGPFSLPEDLISADSKLSLKAVNQWVVLTNLIAHFLPLLEPLGLLIE